MQIDTLSWTEIGLYLQPQIPDVVDQPRTEEAQQVLRVLSQNFAGDTPGGVYTRQAQSLLRLLDPQFQITENAIANANEDSIVVLEDSDASEPEEIPEWDILLSRGHAPPTKVLSNMENDLFRKKLLERVCWIALSFFILF